MKVQTNHPKTEQLALLLSQRFTKEKWTSIFASMEQGSYPEWLLSVQSTPVKEDSNKPEPITSTMGVLGLRSPQQAVLKTGLFDIFPALSYDEEDPVNDAEPSSSTEETISTSIQEFCHRFARLKQKWTSAFQDVEVGHLLVTTDLAKISAATNTLLESMGQPVSIDGMTFTNVWQALVQINAKLQEGLAQVQDSTNYISDIVEDMNSNYTVMQDSHLLLQTTISSIQDTMRKYESRFSKILPVLMNVQQSSTSSSLLEVDQKLMQMSQAVEVFQCFEDVKSWVVAKFQIRRYGLFVDGVSLLDFFTFVAHMDTEKSMSAFYNQVKSGFASMYEARLAVSTQNLFPMVFGRSNSAGMDDSEYLPALQDPDRWDNGITGLRYQISRGMSDVETQLETTIDSVLKDYPEPRQIAKECLYKSKRFVMDLCAFITQDFQKWQHRGHSKKDSWRMTTICVRRVFEEIHSQRVITKDILDVQDGDFSCAKFLWATWKAHETMALYVKHQFYEHPSIAAVLARHLADNHVKPDDAVASKVAAVEKAIKSINARLDSVQNMADNAGADIKSLTQSVAVLSRSSGGGDGNRVGKTKKTDKTSKDPKSG
jgi:hypothetical protein